MNTFDQLKTMQRERQNAQEKKTKPQIQEKSIVACTKTSLFDYLKVGKTSDASIPCDLNELPMDWRIEYEERAAILEYDGGLSREDADKQALIEIAERIKNQSDPIKVEEKDI